MKIVLIGAGSAQFGMGTLSDIFQTPALKGSEIALVDLREEAVEAVRQTAQACINDHGLPFRLTSTTDRRTALAGADFVIISIEVGDRFRLWDQDWQIPQQFGIRQIYGETGGAGGLFHALRIIPPILEICADIDTLCPRAWTFCYSNPLTAITTAVLRRFPHLRFIGLCHEIASLERYLPAILGTPFSNLDLTAGGLNHFSVLTRARYRDSGRDAYPDILAKAPAFFEKEPGSSDIWEYAQKTGTIPETEGATHRHQIHRETASRPWSDRTLFREILERFHLLPITVDSHLGEYIPWAWQTADHKGILDFYHFYQFALNSQNHHQIDTSARKERVTFIMEALIGAPGASGTSESPDRPALMEPAVNLLNQAVPAGEEPTPPADSTPVPPTPPAPLIPGLPADIAVEVPARITADTLTPQPLPDYPRGFGALLRNYTGVYDLTAEAALHGSKELALQALLVNPVTGHPGRAAELLDLMIDLQKDHLGYLK